MLCTQHVPLIVQHNKIDHQLRASCVSSELQLSIFLCQLLVSLSFAEWRLCEPLCCKLFCTVAVGTHVAAVLSIWNPMTNKATLHGHICLSRLAHPSTSGRTKLQLFSWSRRHSIHLGLSFTMRQIRICLQARNCRKCLSHLCQPCLHQKLLSCSYCFRCVSCFKKKSASPVLCRQLLDTVTLNSLVKSTQSMCFD